MKKAGLNGGSIVRCVLIIILFISAATGVGFLFRSIGFYEVNTVIVYILSVLLTARFTQGYAYGIAASLAATVTFNFFFTEPHYSLSVNDPSYFITFAVMTITAIVNSALTSKEKQSAARAQERESETNALYHLTTQLSDARDPDEIAGITAHAISQLLGCQARLLCSDENGKPEEKPSLQSDVPDLLLSDSDEKKEKGRSLKQSPCEPADGCHELPVRSRDTLHGVLYIPQNVRMNDSQTRLIHSMTESTAMAMDRLRSVQDRIKATEAATQERYRGNLLRAISHDLRTPLASIMGMAEMLANMSPEDDLRHSLAEDIYRETNWLHSLVQNILNLTRLRDGAMNLTMQMVPVEEVVGGAVHHVGKLSGREIIAEAPDEVLFVPMDAGLIEQVLVNLLDNAVKHTPPWEEIRISVRRDDEKSFVRILVSDRGSGILTEDLPNIFQMFYTASARRSDASRGMGLGLTICAAIVEAHGGTIQARNRADGHGAEFEFTLPLEEKHEPETK